MAEDIRSGLRGVPRGQLDAARALGYEFLPAIRLIIRPQALRLTVPPLISQTLNLWKNTSIATVANLAVSLPEQFSSMLVDLVIFNAAYLAEIVHAGLQGLPQGQMAAAPSTPMADSSPDLYYLYY